MLGPYHVVDKIGEGGMGEVYRARDTRLSREVAIKVLARAGTDPTRQRRFLEEAQAASALNHPNIVTVYDVGHQEQTPYIVSELVEGTSLRGVITKAPLPTRELLDLGVQMAEGLAAAHQAGIVHRDFKPENVMVTRDGRVKILDFGLALVGLRDGVSAAEVDVTLSASGLIVGTVPYMSPEQARGSAVDFRTDQFSLGLTLYEMATGRRAFSAETAPQILAAILEDEPEPIANANPRVPAPVRWTIERCLTKDSRQRYDATADLARELRTLRDRMTELGVATDVAPPAEQRRWRGSLIAASASLLIGIALAILVMGWSSTSRTELSTHRLTPIATAAGYESSPAWSPDGKTLAYIADVDGTLQIFTRALSSSMRAQVTHARFDCMEPLWSTDGTRLYYRSLARDRPGLWSISSAGGEPELVSENVSRAALSPDGRTLAFFREGENDSLGLQQLWLSSPIGSKPVQYTRPPFGERRGYYSSPQLAFSPDGSKLGVWAVPWWAEVKRAQAEFWVLPMDDAAPYLAPPPVADLPTFTPAFSWFPDSHRIVSAVPHPRPGVHLWVSNTERTDARLLTMTADAEDDPAVSPDGTRLALSLRQLDYNVYRLSPDDGEPSSILATSRNEMDPAWSPVNPEMAFTTDQNGQEEIWLRSQKGDWERPLVTSRDFGASQTYYLSSPAFSPDGQRIAYTRLGSDETRIWITPVNGGPPVPLDAGEYVQDAPAWSPDGGWIAYAQLKLGELSLAKKRVGAKTPPEVLATGIADWANVKWSPDGLWIAYNARDGVSLVSPDGKSKRVLQEQRWLAFVWSADSRILYGFRQSDDLKYLTFTAIDIRTTAERVLNADFLPLSQAGLPVRGLTRVSPTSFLTSIATLTSDVWMLEGFDAPRTFWDRVTTALLFRGSR